MKHILLILLLMFGAPCYAEVSRFRTDSKELTVSRIEHWADIYENNGWVILDTNVYRCKDNWFKWCGELSFDKNPIQQVGITTFENKWECRQEQNNVICTDLLDNVQVVDNAKIVK